MFDKMKKIRKILFYPRYSSLRMTGQSSHATVSLLNLVPHTSKENSQQCSILKLLSVPWPVFFPGARIWARREGGGVPPVGGLPAVRHFDSAAAATVPEWTAERYSRTSG
jgi:hypothetical protein